MDDFPAVPSGLPIPGRLTVTGQVDVKAELKKKDPPRSKANKIIEENVIGNKGEAAGCVGEAAGCEVKVKGDE